MNMNKWTGVGRLTKDAELTETKKGSSMAKFRIAVNDRQYDDVLFINILCFGKTAETLHPMLVKGRIVGIDGKLRVSDYENDEGQKAD